MKSILFIIIMAMGCSRAMAQQPAAENLVVITLDGFRWQELFGGMDDSLLFNKAYTFDSGELIKKYGGPTAFERRKKLMPFIWNTVAQQGQVYGNRRVGSYVNVQNRYWFSYPGYNEMFTGYPDTAVNSNDKNPNANTTVLEFLNGQRGFKGKVAAFTSWDCFDAILNEGRAGFPVSAGFDSVHINSAVFDLLNDMQWHAPQPLGETVRPDHITYYIAKEYIKKKKPRVLYIGFDETDDYAHEGKYDYYLNAAHLTDAWLADLWQTLQGMKQYKNNTTLLILCDHGRGDIVKADWRNHNSKVVGADQIWLAVMGPGIPARGEMHGHPQLYQSQVAQTIAGLLGQTFAAGNQPIAPAITFDK